MNTDDEILAVLREIRDQQAAHQKAVLARLEKIDTDAREQRAKEDAQAVQNQENIRRLGMRFFFACLLLISAYLFLPMMGDAIQSFFARLVD